MYYCINLLVCWIYQNILLPIDSCKKLDCTSLYYYFFKKGYKPRVWERKIQQKISRDFINKKIKIVTKVIYLICDEICSVCIEKKTNLIKKNKFWDTKLINNRTEKKWVSKFLCILKYHLNIGIIKCEFCDIYAIKICICRFRNI